MKENLQVNQFSLKTILENLDKIPSNGKSFGDEQQPLSKDEAKKLMELVSKFNEYGKVLRCETALMETAKTLDEIGVMAERYAMTESSDFMEGNVVKRDFKQVKGITQNFKKLAQDCYGKIQQLNALYEDMGHVLQRYYEINSLEEVMAAQNQEASAPAPQSGQIVSEAGKEEQEECGK
jgi:hypothetical protein